MKADPIVVALGVVDELGIAGSSGLCARWRDLGIEAPGDGRTYRRVLGRSDATFRRLDAASRAIVLAAEAAGLSDALPTERRDDVRIVFETSIGSLDADLAFASALRDGVALGHVFPYTLPSAGLGELALRYGLRGESLCLSTLPEQRGAALRETERLFRTEDPEYVVVGCFDVLRTALPSVAARCRAIVGVVARAAGEMRSVAPWPAADTSARIYEIWAETLVR